MSTGQRVVDAPQKSRRTWILAVLVPGLVAVAAFLWSVPRDDQEVAPGGVGPRVVSLSPAVTDTIHHLGAESQLVAVSDFCRAPLALPQVGTALSPSYEALAKMHPTLILATDASADARQKLAALAPTHSLPWLGVEDVAGSIRQLGRLLEKQEPAEKLARQLETQLPREPAKSAPRVLFLMNYGDTGSHEVWFVRKDSLHGGLVHASGAKNAVDRPITGLPKFSVEQLIRLDPEGIVILRGEEPDAAREARLIARLSKLEPLEAVQSGRVAVFSRPDVLHMGPTVLNQIDPLRRIIRGWFPERVP